MTAQILMPAHDFRSSDLSTLDNVQAVSEVFKVTPSAVVMRGRHLGMLGRDDANAYLEELQLAYEKTETHHYNQPLPTTALKKYNGTECSRRMLAILDAGGISKGDFCRVMFSNTLRGTKRINDYRAVVG